ncbi:piggyBac transposable element-derived protein 4-like [Anthonomus grandis grandis]|uniref:piggyBac transposable element-derived protein 4-like n=1 Tax=Anthonomus grandis grandis TaxID=2921223 RepID=UPI002165B1F5|nr:piggyBac transposable element-derived protein 4-like [Anthonomus grandis grandis]
MISSCNDEPHQTSSSSFSASSDSDSADDYAVSTMDTESERYMPVILSNPGTVHDCTWTFGEIVTINAFKDAQYKPQLHVNNIPNMTELDFWLAFFPSEDIDLIIQSTNARLRERQRAVTKGDLYKALGIIYVMTLNSLHTKHTKREYWSTESGLFPAPAFGQRFGMGLHRFEEIINCLAFAIPTAEELNNEENMDNGYQVRAFFHMTTSKWNDIYSPGYKVTVDESMFAWYGKGLHNERDGMPAVIKIQRKPKGVGCECKTIADVQSGIMIGLEINEGKEAMQKKEWQRELGAGTATTLRLTRPWHGSGRIVVGDSWFASVKTAIELNKRGLNFLGIVKTATRNYPIQDAKIRCPEEKDKSIAATCVIADPYIKLTCVAWRDKKVHTFRGSCSTTLPGEPARKKRTDANGKTIIKEVERIKLVEDYFDGVRADDIHNHIRQNGLALETTWNTQRRQHQMFASMFGIIETNAFLAYKCFKKDFNKKHSDFTAALALQLIN